MQLCPGSGQAVVGFVMAGLVEVDFEEWGSERECIEVSIHLDGCQAQRGIGDRGQKMVSRVFNR